MFATLLTRIFQTQALWRLEPPFAPLYLAKVETKRTTKVPSFISHKSGTNFHELGYIKPLIVAYSSSVEACNLPKSRNLVMSRKRLTGRFLVL